MKSRRAALRELRKHKVRWIDETGYIEARDAEDRKDRIKKTNRKEK